jgi:organic hydroperoxide reductase OsmC/OhrA
MDGQHFYKIGLKWQGNTGEGTSNYRSYKRDYLVHIDGKDDLPGSSDPSFRGDPSRYNPEELLVASLSACHMLWYLHLCANAGIVVQQYKDDATGVMQEDKKRGGYFKEVVLRPQVSITDESRKEEAIQLHQRAHELCFIANSVNFEVRHEPILSSVQ